jgi:hypothetical protein
MHWSCDADDTDDGTFGLTFGPPPDLSEWALPASRGPKTFSPSGIVASAKGSSRHETASWSRIFSDGATRAMRRLGRSVNPAPYKFGVRFTCRGGAALRADTWKAEMLPCERSRSSAQAHAGAEAARSFESRTFGSGGTTGMRLTGVLV